MNKQTCIIASMLVLARILQAQPNQQQLPPKPPTTEEKLKRVSEKIDKELQLNTAQKDKILAAYKAFFADIEKYKSKDVKQPLPPPPPPPPVSKEIADKLSGERDAKIKQALTTEQYKKYIELEKILRPKHHGKLGEDGPQRPPEED